MSRPSRQAGPARLRRVVSASGIALAIALGWLLLSGAATSGTGSASPTPTDDRPLTVVSLTFDDGYASQVDAAELLADAGLEATFYLNSGSLGMGAYAERTWVEDLADAGHEVGGHTADHARLTDVSPLERRAAICMDREVLSSAGASVTSFAYPYGAWDATVVEDVRACGYTSARTASGLNMGDGDCSACPVAESIAPLDHRFNIRTPSTVRADDTVEDLVALVEGAEATGGWLPLVFHRVCVGCSEESIELTELEEFTDWLVDRPATTVVRTVGEVTEDPEGLGPDPVEENASGGAGGWWLLPPARESASIDLWGVRVDQFALLGGGTLLFLALVLGHRVVTRRRRYS